MAMEIVVPDHQLSLAIGKRGQNVKLGGQVVDIAKLDIMSESASAAKNSEGHLQLDAHSAHERDDGAEHLSVRL